MFRQRVEPLCNVLLVSFDPYMHQKNPDFATKNAGVICPQDLCLAVDATREVEFPIVIQLSTYDVNNNNPQNLVEKSVRTILKPCGYHVSAPIKADKAMMSFVLVKNADDLHEPFAKLQSRFAA
jgi:hypothetical protein